MAALGFAVAITTENSRTVRITVLDTEPPSPEQVSSKDFSPVEVLVIACVPDTSLSPDQSPDAAHDVVLVDDQVRVNSFDSSTDELDALRVIVAAGVVITGAGAGAEGWESLPPPHETRRMARVDTTYEIFSFIIKFLCRFFKK